MAAFATFLGIDLARHPDAVGIAKEALHAPCEPPWSESVDGDGFPLYTHVCAHPSPHRRERAPPSTPPPSPRLPSHVVPC